MGIPLPWVTEWDLMIGIDGHNQLCIPPTPPLPPLPSPMHKHITGGTMHWILNSYEFPDQTVFVENRWPCKHFHDIAWFIPHVPVPLPGWVLLPVIIPLSASKIMLGAFSIQVQNSAAGAWGPMLNCWSVFPRPTGLIIPTRLPTVFIGFNWLDLLYSALFAGFDMLISFLVNKAFGKWFQKHVEGILSKTLSRIASSEIAAAINQSIKKVVTEVVKKTFGKLVKILPGMLKKEAQDLALEYHGDGRSDDHHPAQHSSLSANQVLGRPPEDQGLDFNGAPQYAGDLSEQPLVTQRDATDVAQRAPQTFARATYDNGHDEIRQAIAEEMATPESGLTPEEILADPDTELPYEEFESAYVQNNGEMIEEGTNGLLSDPNWEQVLDSQGAPTTSAPA